MKFEVWIIENVLWNFNSCMVVACYKEWVDIVRLGDRYNFVFTILSYRFILLFESVSLFLIFGYLMKNWLIFHLKKTLVIIYLSKWMILDSSKYLFIFLFYITLKVSPFGKKFEATQKKLEFAQGNSDHLTMLNGYQVSRDYCKFTPYFNG